MIDNFASCLRLMLQKPADQGDAATTATAAPAAAPVKPAAASSGRRRERNRFGPSI
ncbi:MAG UNVERIFIED_CONTAM: hypothetical protein LVR18_17070 [Planctomycetaceae bacterium]